MAETEMALSDRMDDFSSPGRASTASMPEFITPRSKVAKMLADIDNAPTPSHDDSNRELTSTPSKAYQNDLAGRQSPEDLSAQSKVAMLFQSDDESDDEIRRPMGRAARRMLSGPGDAGHSRLHSSPPASSTPVTAERRESTRDTFSATPRTSVGTPRLHLLPSVHNGGSGLFVSPARSIANDSADDLPNLPSINRGRLAELVAQKRAERLAKESEAEKQHKQRPASSAIDSGLPEDILESSQAESNPEVDRIMSDAAKPTRKASKKAMQEMERETQRIARQQALTHQMRVKKKFTTSSLFARFNFHPTGMSNPSPQTDRDDTISSSAPNSDGFEPVSREPVSTPPSSPPTPLDRQRALVEKGALSKLVPVREDSIASLTELDTGELPDISTILSQGRESIFAKQQPEPKRGLKLARLGKKAMSAIYDDSSDDELEILRAPEVESNMFERAKRSFKGGNSDSHAIHTLKHLAHLHADAVQPRRGRKGASRPSVNPSVLDAQLRLRAKEQARAQQLERIAELKAKGINVQTMEEREREAEEFENLLEKARQEAVALRKAEKAAANADGKQGVGASDDESEDGDYEDSESDGERAEGDKSGSGDLIEDAAEETGDEEDEEEDDEAEQEGDGEHMEIDDQLAGLSEGEMNIADSNDREGDSPGPVLSTALDQDHPQAVRNTRKSRKSRVVLDEDDDDEDREESIIPGPADQARPTQDEEQDEEQDPFAAFNFGGMGNNAALMSPTQAFQATMQTPTQLTQQDSMDILRQLAPPSVSSVPSIPMPLDSQVPTPSRTAHVESSQVPDSQKVNLLWETQPPETPVTTRKRGSSAVQTETPGWQPSQDIGLPLSWQGGDALQREDTLDSIMEHDTQSTVRLRISASPAPANVAPRRKRFVQRQGAIIESSDEEDDGNTLSLEAKQKDAFREMARKRKQALSAAELADAEREMKHMMDEQAEESEDEYAGLGGDDYVAPETEQDRAMIDSSHVEVDERALAAHFAERQRVADEAEASKLYKDLMTGALRRKQANMFDLGEDEDDLAVRRRQLRQREEARKRRLLLQDDNIAGLAEGKLSKGKDAFLKAIADDDGADDDYLDTPAQDEETSDSQTQSDTQPSQTADASTAPLREVSGNKRRMDEDIDERPPAKSRRTQASALRAPTSLLEVKESVSFLLDEADNIKFCPSVLELGSDSEPEQGSSDIEGDEQADDDDDDATAAELARQNDGGFAPDPVNLMPPPRLPASQRRTRVSAAVVDRLSLKRGSSTSDGAAIRTAWGPAASGAFKAPSLLRRATTNVAAGANDRGVTTSNGLSRENSGVKMGGSKKSSLAYQARAEERKAQVEAGARRRAENTARIAQLRRGNSSLLGSGLGGRFE